MRSQWADQEVQATRCYELLVTNMVFGLLSKDFSHFLLSLFCLSGHNPTQVGAASWQHWSSSIFVYPLRLHLITRVSVRPRECGNTAAANGRHAACVLSKSHSVCPRRIMPLKKICWNCSHVCGPPCFFQLRLDIRLLGCLHFLFFTEPAKIPVPLRWALTVVVEDQSPSWSANTAVEAKISNTDLVIKVSARGR